MRSANMVQVTSSPANQMPTSPKSTSASAPGRFEHIVLLSAPLSVLLHRVARRTNNPYGASASQQEEIAGYLETVEPLLRREATIELDGRRSVTDLADAIESLCAPV